MNPRYDRFAWLVVGHIAVLLVGVAVEAVVTGTVNPGTVGFFVPIYGGGLLISVAAYWTGRKDGAR